MGAYLPVIIYKKKYTIFHLHASCVISRGKCFFLPLNITPLYSRSNISRNIIVWVSQGDLRYLSLDCLLKSETQVLNYTQFGIINTPIHLKNYTLVVL